MGSWKRISLGKVCVNMFSGKFSKWVVGNLGRLVGAYLQKDDMHFVSGSYMTEVNDYIEKSGLFFLSKKLKRKTMGPTISTRT